jgi:hypothetical protein
MMVCGTVALSVGMTVCEKVVWWAGLLASLPVAVSAVW